MAEAAQELGVQADGARLPQNRPDYRHPLYEEEMSHVEVVRDVAAGTKHMRDQGKKYLPRNPYEEEDEYERRLLKAKLFNAVDRTREGLIGMIFKRDPIRSEDMPPKLAEDLDNVDLGGRDLSAFGRDVTKAAVTDGHTFIHVEAPPLLTIENPDGSRRPASEAEEQQARQRPYWVHVTKGQAINWRWETVRGQPTLTLFVYVEEATEPEGSFGHKRVQRYRVLRPGEFEVWERQTREDSASGETRAEFKLVSKGRTSVPYIPIVTVYAKRVGFMFSRPPLLDLAWENIEHWRIRNVRQQALDYTATAIPVFTGEKQDDIKWAPNRGLALPNPDSKAFMLEAHGYGLAELRLERTDVESNLAALGLSQLVRETRQAETAEAKRLDASESDSALASYARFAQTAFNEALAIHGEYRKLDSVGAIDVNDDFRQYEIDPALLRELNGMVSDGNLTLETLWAQMQRGELLPEDFDAELERARLGLD